MLALDHLVIATQDRSIASNTFRKKTGIKPVVGGRHENWGTSNDLAYFSNDCYIEWLMIDQKEKAYQARNPLIQHTWEQLINREKEGIFQFAFRTNQLDFYIEHFERNKIPYIGPVAASRITPEGKLISWQMLFPLYDWNVETLPFLIQWDQAVTDRITPANIQQQAITNIYINCLTSER